MRADGKRGWSRGGPGDKGEPVAAICGVDEYLEGDGAGARKSDGGLDDLPATGGEGDRGGVGGYQATGRVRAADSEGDGDKAGLRTAGDDENLSDVDAGGEAGGVSGNGDVGGSAGAVRGGGEPAFGGC